MIIAVVRSSVLGLVDRYARVRLPRRLDIPSVKHASGVVRGTTQFDHRMYLKRLITAYRIYVVALGDVSLLVSLPLEIRG
jgi:hypothetical protein